MRRYRPPLSITKHPACQHLRVMRHSYRNSAHYSYFLQITVNKLFTTFRLRVNYTLLYYSYIVGAHSNFFYILLFFCIQNVFFLNITRFSIGIDKIHIDFNGLN